MGTFQRLLFSYTANYYNLALIYILTVTLTENILHFYNWPSMTLWTKWVQFCFWRATVVQSSALTPM